VRSSFEADMRSTPLPWQCEFANDGRIGRITAVMDQLGLYIDGTPRPLTLKDRLLFSSPRKRLVAKITRARKKAREIVQVLSGLGKYEEDLRDMVLMQNFILEQLSPVNRAALEREFFALHRAHAESIDGRLWAFCWFLVFCMFGFLFYWTLAWALASSDTTFTAWGTQFGLHIIQDIFLSQLLIVFSLHVVAAEAMRPQLKFMYKVLGDVAVNHSVNAASKFTDEIRICQHLSPSCRAARSLVAMRLPAAVLLRGMNDIDVALCRQNRSAGVGTIIFTILSVPIAIAALGTSYLQDLSIELIWVSIWSAFLLFNDTLAAVHPALLAAVYAFFPLLCLWHYWIRPSYVRRRQKKRVEAVINKQKLIASWNQTEPPSNVFVSCKVKKPTKDDDIAWRNMNLPSFVAGRINKLVLFKHVYIVRSEEFGEVNDLVRRGNWEPFVKKKYRQFIDIDKPSSFLHTTFQSFHSAKNSLCDHLEASDVRTEKIQRWKEQRLEFNVVEAQYVKSRYIFMRLDKNNKGYIEPQELEKLAKKYWRKRYGTEKPTTSELDELMDRFIVQLDIQESGRITYEQFRKWYQPFADEDFDAVENEVIPDDIEEWEEKEEDDGVEERKIGKEEIKPVDEVKEVEEIPLRRSLLGIALQRKSTSKVSGSSNSDHLVGNSTETNKVVGVITDAPTFEGKKMSFSTLSKVMHMTKSWQKKTKRNTRGSASPDMPSLDVQYEMSSSASEESFITFNAMDLHNQNMLAREGGGQTSVDPSYMYSEGPENLHPTTHAIRLETSVGGARGEGRPRSTGDILTMTNSHQQDRNAIEHRPLRSYVPTPEMRRSLPPAWLNEYSSQTQNNSRNVFKYWMRDSSN